MGSQLSAEDGRDRKTLLILQRADEVLLKNLAADPTLVCLLQRLSGVPLHQAVEALALEREHSETDVDNLAIGGMQLLAALREVGAAIPKAFAAAETVPAFIRIQNWLNGPILKALPASGHSIALRFAFHPVYDQFALLAIQYLWHRTLQARIFGRPKGFG